MSLADVRPYMRVILDGLSYREWTDGFNFQNIPSTTLDGSYHIEVVAISSSPANQRAFRYSFPVLLRVFRKGFIDPAGAIDKVLSEADDILSGVLAESARLGNPAIKNVFPGNVRVIPFDETNDNAVILEMEFIFDLVECY